VRGKGLKLIAALAVVMLAVFALGVLAAADTINLPGSWREKLGLADSTPNHPCRVDIYRFSPRTPPEPAGRWRFEPEVPRTQIEASATAIGPVIYVVGGSPPGNLHTFLAYDTRSRRWSRPTRLPTGLNHSQPAVHDGKLYLAGGYLDGEVPTANFWEYDPESNRWRKLPDLPEPSGAGAVVTIGDRLYVATGTPQTFQAGGPIAPYDTVQIYDFGTGEWSYGAEVPNPRNHVGAAALGGKLYVVGGRIEAAESVTDFDRYDPVADRWESLPDAPIRAGSPGAVAIGGKIVLVGGEEQNNWEEGEGWVTPSAWAFDPRTERWQRLPDMAYPRRAGGVAAAGGRIYAIGGSYCAGLKPNGPVGTHTVESLPMRALNR
jgi:N-acetylneuraminic acid mutarotase